MYIMYHVTFVPNGSRAALSFSADAVEHSAGALRSYHISGDTRFAPDYAAIRAALPYNHRAAYDRGTWWFPMTLLSKLSGVLDMDNACCMVLSDRKGRYIGTLYATPYLKER